MNTCTWCNKLLLLSQNSDNDVSNKPVKGNQYSAARKLFAVRLKYRILQITICNKGFIH